MITKRMPSEVNSKFGAPMGRGNISEADRDAAIELRVEPLPMMQGDEAYDAGGAYWGLGDKKSGWVWWAYDAEETVEMYFRAKSSSDAANQVRAEYPNATQQMDPEGFVRGYIEAARFFVNEDEGITDQEFAPEAHERMEREAREFAEQNRALLDQARDMGFEDDQLGHDLWLTRNRHGVGYWDRGMGNLGRQLTEAAHLVGERDLYLGDDKLVHVG